MLWQSTTSTCEPHLLLDSTISPGKASQSISSLIQKFEALSSRAANNTHVRKPLLRTPRKLFPQKVQRHISPIEASPEHKGAIFSPTRKGKSRFGGIVPDGDLCSGKGDIFSTGLQGYGRGMNLCGSISLHRGYTRHAECMVPERGSFSNVPRNSKLERAEFTPRTRDRMPSSGRGRQIKDKIRFFEESGKKTGGPRKVYPQLWSLGDDILFGSSIADEISFFILK